MKTGDKSRILSSVVFAASTVFILTIAGLYFYNIVRWAGYPDFGFGFRSATGIRIVGVVTENGAKAGMRIGDRILTVNLKPFETLQDFRAAMNRGVGESNIYELERDNRRFAVTVYSIPQGFRNSFSRSGFSFVVGVCYFLIGVLVFLMKPHTRSSWIFFVFTSVFCLFLTYIYQLTEMSPSWLENFSIFAYCFTPAVFIHLSLTFPEERGAARRYPFVHGIPYLVSTILFIVIRSSTHTMYSAPKASMMLAVLYMALGVLFFLSSCFYLRVTSPSHIVKLRARMILLGFGIAASIPLLDYVINAFFEVYLVPGFNYYLPFFIVFPAFVGYSIVKHDLFDIDAIIKRTYGYVLTTGTIAGFYGVFVLLSNLAFGGFAFTRSPVFPLIFILGVVFFFNPIRNRVQRVIDRVFYRLEYDYQQTVEKISETMRSLIGLDETVKAILNTALGTMFIDSGCVMLRERDKTEYRSFLRYSEAPTGSEGREGRASGRDKNRHEPGTKGGQGEEKISLLPAECSLAEMKLPAEDPLIQKMAERKKELTIYDIQEDPYFEEDRELCAKSFNELGAMLVIPLIYEDRLTGLISLGRKKSGKFYRREDINLLKTLANQGAVAIENAFMIEDVIEKERMEEELSIARDLQMSMLPAVCPQVKGFEIAAVCVPAKEVGGDFFDFVVMGEEKLCFLVGDVTGKSVSGALVMSAARSVFRMLSEEQLTVSEIMIRANRRVKMDIKTGMFVALLYALLDGKKNILTLCSAGQTQPIHRSAITGETRLIQTEGDTFPLGILDEVEYMETYVQLEPGDKLVFYTDGIVEAMNKEQEMFGFELLLEVVRETSTRNSEDLLKEIMNRVNEFSGGAPQNDDLTAIVVTVPG